MRLLASSLASSAAAAAAAATSASASRGPSETPGEEEEGAPEDAASSEEEEGDAEAAELSEEEEDAPDESPGEGEKIWLSAKTEGIWKYLTSTWTADEAEAKDGDAKEEKGTFKDTGLSAADEEERMLLHDACILHMLQCYWSLAWVSVTLCLNSKADR